MKKLRLLFPILAFISCQNEKVDLLSFRTGKYIHIDTTNNIHANFERFDSIQIQYDLYTGDTIICNIKWLNDTSYVLYNFNSRTIDYDTLQMEVKVQILDYFKDRYKFKVYYTGFGFTYFGELIKVDSFSDLNTFVFNDSVKIKTYVLFDKIEIAIPDIALPSENKSNLDIEKMGFAYFNSQDDKIDITVRKMEYMPLEQVKSMMDVMSTGLYNGKILRSEIITKNNTKIYITDVDGYWNGGDRMGMFRFYFNDGDNSYNLLMKYPFWEIEKSQKIKELMLDNIKVINYTQHTI